jgi:hypothetical protein
MAEEKYQGYTNRETWLVNLYLQQDADVESDARRIAKAYEGTEVPRADRPEEQMAAVPRDPEGCGKALCEMLIERANNRIAVQFRSDLRNFILDALVAVQVRVDYKDLGEHWLND